MPWMAETTASFSVQLQFTLRADPLCALSTAWVMGAKGNSVMPLKIELQQMHARRLNPCKENLILALPLFCLQTSQSCLSKKTNKNPQHASFACFILHPKKKNGAVWLSHLYQWSLLSKITEELIAGTGSQSPLEKTKKTLIMDLPKDKLNKNMGSLLRFRRLCNLQKRLPFSPIFNHFCPIVSNATFPVMWFHTESQNHL